MKEKHTIIAALQQFIADPPNLRRANYGSQSSYDADVRAARRDKQDAERLISAVACIQDISADDLKDGFRAFSGRLQWNGSHLEYTTGQYRPTEYRKAVCAVCAAVVGRHFARDPELRTWSEVRQAVEAYFRNPAMCKRWFR